MHGKMNLTIMADSPQMSQCSTAGIFSCDLNPYVLIPPSYFATPIYTRTLDHDYNTESIAEIATCGHQLLHAM